MHWRMTEWGSSADQRLGDGYLTGGFQTRRGCKRASVIAQICRAGAISQRTIAALFRSPNPLYFAKISTPMTRPSPYTICAGVHAHWRKAMTC